MVESETTTVVVVLAMPQWARIPEPLSSILDWEMLTCAPSAADTA